MNKCFYCNSDLIWMNDFDLEDVTGDVADRDGIMTNYICQSCLAEYEVIKRGNDED